MILRCGTELYVFHWQEALSPTCTAWWWLATSTFLRSRLRACLLLPASSFSHLNTYVIAHQRATPPVWSDNKRYFQKYLHVWWVALKKHANVMVVAALLFIHLWIHYVTEGRPLLVKLTNCHAGTIRRTLILQQLTQVLPKRKNLMTHIHFWQK